MSELTKSVVRWRTRNQESKWIAEKCACDNSGRLGMREILARYEEETGTEIVGRNRERVRKNFQRAFKLMGVKRVPDSADYFASWVDRPPKAKPPRKRVPDEEARAFLCEYIERRGVSWIENAILQAFNRERGPVHWMEGERLKKVFRDEMIQVL